MVLLVGRFRRLRFDGFVIPIENGGERRFRSIDGCVDFKVCGGRETILGLFWMIC